MLSGLFLTAALLAPCADPVTPPPSLPDIPIPALPAGQGNAQTPPGTLPPVFGPGTQTPMAPPPRPEGVPPAPGTEMAPSYAIMTEPEAPAKKSLNNPHQGPSYSLWGGVEYSLFFLKNGPSPNVLLQSTPAGGGATNVIGGVNDDFGQANGFRFNAGLWLNDCHTLGLGIGGFMVEQRAVLGAANSDAAGNPTLSRPFTNAVVVQAAQALVSSPGTLSGTFFSRSSSRLSGAEIYLINNLHHDKAMTIDLLLGGTYVDLDESINLTQQTSRIGGVPLSFPGFPNNPAITGITINDHFRTRNQFYGGTMGVRGEYRLGAAFVNLTAKVGLGNNRQTIDIDGSSQATGIGAGAVPGGFLAVTGGNIGRSTSNRFSILSEAGAAIGFQVASFARISVGYNFLYLNNVVRPGSQIDTVINTRLVPTSSNFNSLTGIASPVPTGKQDDFFANSINFGIELQF